MHQNALFPTTNARPVNIRPLDPNPSPAALRNRKARKKKAMNITKEEKAAVSIYRAEKRKTKMNKMTEDEKIASRIKKNEQKKKGNLRRKVTPPPPLPGLTEVESCAVRRRIRAAIVKYKRIMKRSNALQKDESLLHCQAEAQEVSEVSEDQTVHFLFDEEEIEHADDGAVGEEDDDSIVADDGAVGEEDDCNTVANVAGSHLSLPFSFWRIPEAPLILITQYAQNDEHGCPNGASAVMEKLMGTCRQAREALHHSGELMAYLCRQDFNVDTDGQRQKRVLRSNAPGLREYRVYRSRARGTLMSSEDALVEIQELCSAIPARWKKSKGMKKSMVSEGKKKARLLSLERLKVILEKKTEKPFLNGLSLIELINSKGVNEDTVIFPCVKEVVMTILWCI